MRNSFPLSPTGFCALLLLAPLGLVAAPAQAQTTINFNNLTTQAHADGGSSLFGSSYSTPSTQGFTFTSDIEFFAIAGDDPIFGDGETSLYADAAHFTTLTQDNGQTFSFNAINLGPLGDKSHSAQYAGPTLFTGTHADGSTVTATVTTTSARYQTFSFTGFSSLTSLTFVGSFNPATGNQSASQFNNVVLNSPAPVPEASTTVSLGLLLALGGVVVAVRKKKACASA